MREVSNEVLAVLDGLAIEQPKSDVGDPTVHVRIAEQLRRELYLQVNEVLEACGGVWNRRVKAHVFASDPRPKLDEVILNGGYQCPKRDFGFFETPPELAARVVDLAQIRYEHTVLEPSAGRGALAREVRHRGNKPPFCIEIQEDNVKALLADGFKVIAYDFLTYQDQDGFDRIVMNPPFAGQADIDHVLHAITQLNEDGGRLVAVMAAGVKFRTNAKAVKFREEMSLATLAGATVEIYNNPPGSFRASGTDVNTVTLVFDWGK